MNLSVKRLFFLLSLSVIPAALNAYAAAEAPAGAAKPVPKAIPLSGKVLETMDGGGYTYVLLKNGGEKVWVAVPLMKVTVGQEISFVPGFEFKNFNSKGLNRKFDKVVFSAGPANQQIKLGTEAMKMAHKGMSAEEAKGKAAAPATPAAAPKEVAASTVAAETKAYLAKADVKKTAPKTQVTKDAVASKEAPKKAQHVAKAKGPNSYTIEQLYAKKTKLEKKPVVVRGKVVKVTERILKRNWIHIQDGSGSTAKKNNVLVVTTAQTPKEGDVVTVSGTAYNNLDFGYGYKYSLLVQATKVSK